MGKCIYSHDDGAYCDKHDHGAVTVGCCGEDKCPDRKVLSNADCIRAMSDEELARQLAFLEDFNYDEPRVLEWLDWLRQEA